MSSLLEHRHGEKTHFSSNEKRTVFVKPNERCRACSNIVMARKRTFQGTRKERNWLAIKRCKDKDCSVSEFYGVSPKL